MPRIAHVISTPEGIGGAERIVGWLCKAGRERGWRQVVLNPFARDPERAALRDEVGRAEYAGYPCAHLYEVPRTRRWLRRELRAFEPDLVHVHLFHAAALTASLCGLTPRLLTHHHGNNVISAGRRLQARIDRWSGSRYDAVVAISGWSARFLRDEYGYPPPPVTTIINGWSGEPLPDASDPEAETIVSIGNLRPEKGFDRLLRAFALISESRPDARLRVLGDGAERERLAAQASALGVEDRVTWLGWQPSPWEELSRANVFALASVIEPLGIAALEAMAAGLPVVAPRVGGLVDVVEDGRTGLLTPPGDERAMAAALSRLLADPQEAAAMGATGKVVAASHRADEMVDAYFRLYEELI